MKKIALLLFLAVLTLSATDLPNIDEGTLLNAEDAPKMYKETDDYSILKTYGKFNIIIIQTDREGFEFDANDEDAEFVEIVVDEDILTATFDTNEKQNDWINLFVYDDTLTTIELYGETVISNKEEIIAEQLFIINNGGLIAELKGKVSKVLMDNRVNGMADVNFENLETVEMNVMNHGTGEFRVNVKEILEVEIAGTGDVYYKGNPEKINEIITGKGSLKQIK